MANLMSALKVYRDSNLQTRIQEFESFLPEEFYLVDYCSFPGGESQPTTKFLGETESQAQEWVRKYVTSVLLHESGTFYHQLYGNRHEERFWTAIHKLGKKRDNGRPLAGAYYLIWKTAPVHLALRSLLYVQ